MVEGVEIEVEGMVEKKKKKAMRDFKNVTQYISAQKNPSVRTEFDDLPRIKNTDIDATIQDENPVKKSSSKRVWDKNKKNFVWQRDEEDKMSKD